MASPSSPSPPPAAPQPSLADTLFQRSLDDLIKSLRADPSTAGESAAVSRALSEIHREIRSPDASTKSTALQKLTYLSSLHFVPISSSSLAFPAIELLASPSLPSKRLAYLAASLSLHPSSLSLLPLCIHQLHKDLSAPPSSSSWSSSPSSLLSSLALHLLASPAASPDLATHLAPDLVSHLGRGNPKAVAAAARAITLSPSATVPVLFEPLAACLSSADPRVSSAAASAFCELSAPPADPSPFLPLAPDLYNLLTTSRSNWALIKVLKILARLAQLEPRLAARVADPVCQLLGRSPAKSLAFECIRTILSALPFHDVAVRLAIEKAKEFLSDDDDANLRYLGLQALGLLGPAYSWAVLECRDAVARYLTDPDRNICREALRLMMGMVGESNVADIAGLLVSHAAKSDPEFASDILGAILAACGRDVYELVSDFDWYVSLLADMARSPHCAQGGEIGRQLVDVGLRVQDARPELVHAARSLLIDPALLGNHLLCPVLSAAAWVSGEYVEFSKDHVELVEALLQPRTSLLPMSVRAVYIQAVLKVFTFCCNSYIERLNNSSNGMEVMLNGLAIDQTISGVSEDEIDTSEEQVIVAGLGDKKDPLSHKSIVYMINLIETTVGPLAECNEVEVQERARNVLGFIHLLREVRDSEDREVGNAKDSRIREFVKLMQTVFSQELGPVSANAQKKVSVPEGLVLNENLVELADIVSEDDTAPPTSIVCYPRSRRPAEVRDEPAVSVGSSSLLDEHRKRHGLYYLPTGKVKDESNDYPRANDPLLSSSHDSATEDTLKLTEPVLVGRKTKATKPRPTVVKLDEGDDIITSVTTSAKVSKDDLLSGALRDMLLGRDGKPSSSQKSLDGASQGMPNKVDTGESIPQGIENVDLGLGGNASSSSRRNKHRSHNKERHRNPQENKEKGERKHKSSTRSGQHQGRHKHRQRTDPQLGVVPQAPVIQDFLL